MKVPEPKKQKSGQWYVQLRLGGKSYSFTKPTARECRDAARTFKSDYLAGRIVDQPEDASPQPHEQTLSQLFDSYLANKDNSLSPSTIRFYRTVQKSRFQSLMESTVSTLTKDDWQKAVNDEAARYAPKTLHNSITAIKTVVENETSVRMPRLSLPGKIINQKKFLTPDEIPKFVDAVKGTKYAVPLLLALSSMRISEIDALDWRDIPENAKFIQVKGSRVLDENNWYVKKEQNKNDTSTRPIPIFIPELADAIKRDRQPCGPVMPCSQNNLRLACHRICQKAGVTDISVHELRHSFASLAYHLQIPEEIAMRIGGWSDPKTMRKIYTHIAQADIDSYSKDLFAFFGSNQTVGENSELAGGIEKSPVEMR